MIGLAHPHSAGHLRTLDALEAIDTVVLYDADPAVRAAAAASSRKAGDIETTLEAVLARPDVSVVVIAVPTDQVVGTVVSAARAGKHVICEKPCGRSAGEFRPVVDVLARASVNFAVCYVWRMHPAVARMRELLRAGALGRLTSAELRMVTSQVRLRDPQHWLFRQHAAGGGVFSWLGCHWLDALRYVTDQEVCAVSAMMGHAGRETIDVEDIGSANLRLSGGALVNLYAGYLLPFGRAGYEGATFDLAMVFRGEAGVLRYEREGDEHVVRLQSTAPGFGASEQVDRYVLPPVQAYGGGPGVRFVETFLRGVVDGSLASPATALDALRVLEILDGIYASAQTGTVVQVAASA
jgi:predicted dehydrogenase